jgi:hypothetical protein
VRPTGLSITDCGLKNTDSVSSVVDSYDTPEDLKAALEESGSEISLCAFAMNGWMGESVIFNP